MCVGVGKRWLVTIVRVHSSEIYYLNNKSYLYVMAQKICYDNPGNVPNKRRNFNTQKLGKCIYLLFVWLAVIGFRQNYLYILPNFGDFGAKMSFFHYIMNQKRNNFIKHCSPVYQEATRAGYDWAGTFSEWSKRQDPMTRQPTTNHSKAASCRRGF